MGSGARLTMREVLSIARMLCETRPRDPDPLRDHLHLARSRFPLARRPPASAGGLFRWRAPATMTDDRFHVFDTTLRDGAQREGISYSVTDKIAVARLLDELGVGFIE